MGERPQQERFAATNVGELIAEGRRRLAEAGSASAYLDSLLLLGHATGRPKASLLAHPEAGVDPTAVARYRDLVARRAAHEPVAYLLGEREFYGRTFRVDRRALIPRPETEMLVEIGVRAARRWLARGVVPRVVDVGTGSGAIAVSVAAELQTNAPGGVEQSVPTELLDKIVVLATDYSADALVLARENAAQLSQRDRVQFVQTDLLAGVRGPIHVLLANLPYIPAGRLLPPDVQEYEPRTALVGGPIGTEQIERLLHQAQPLLAPGGTIALEIDESGQAAPVAASARALYPGAGVRIQHDATGRERVVLAHLPEMAVA